MHAGSGSDPFIELLRTSSLDVIYGGGEQTKMYFALETGCFVAF